MPPQAADIHTPVLLAEVLKYLQPRSGGLYVDGTLGLGGHSEAILKASAPAGRLIAFDWDDNALELAGKRLEGYGDRVIVKRYNFADLQEGLANLGIDFVDGILVDIGLSSLQLDRGGRGFSFLRDEPLDMRMDTRGRTTAAGLLARCSEEELADIFYYYGEEKQARRIAAEIAKIRRSMKIESSKQLAGIVAGAIPRRYHPKKIHVATKTFQGLRIAVNSELENLAAVIEAAEQCLYPGGRCCVISFHSLEDRIVKRKIQESDVLEAVVKRPVRASPGEVAANPRSRSAKMRVAVKKTEGKEVVS